jgi:hypothetical protein
MKIYDLQNFVVTPKTLALHCLYSAIDTGLRNIMFTARILDKFHKKNASLLFRLTQRRNYTISLEFQNNILRYKM